MFTKSGKDATDILTIKSKLIAVMYWMKTGLEFVL